MTVVRDIVARMVRKIYIPFNMYDALELYMCKGTFNLDDKLVSLIVHATGYVSSRVGS